MQTSLLTHTQSKKGGEKLRKSRALKNSVNIPSVSLCLPAGNGDSTCRQTHGRRRTAQAPGTLPSRWWTRPASAALSQLSVGLRLLHPTSDLPPLLW